MAEGRWFRLLPTRRRVVIYVAGLLGLLVVRGALNLWAGYRLRTVSARIEQSYGKLDLAALAPPAVAPAENRARILSAAAALTVRQPALANRGELTQALLGSPAEDPAKRQAVLRQAVEENRIALEVLEEAESRPKSNWEISYHDGAQVRLPSLAEIRDLSLVNAAAALLDLDEGDANGAARRARLGMVLARSLAQEPNLLVQLIRMAIAHDQCRLLRVTLAQGSPSLPALEALATLLEAERRERPAVVGLIGELKFQNSLFRGFDRGNDVWTGSREEGFAWSTVFPWLLRPAIHVAHARTLEQDDKIIQYARLDPFERQVRTVKPPSGEPQPWWWRQFGEVFTVGLERAVRSGDEHRAVMTLGATAVALRRFRQERGSYPASLGALVPALLPSAPIDPFTGGQVGYTLAGDGFELRVTVPPDVVPAERFVWKLPS